MLCTQHLKSAGQNYTKPEMLSNPDAACQLCEVEPYEFKGETLFLCDQHSRLLEEPSGSSEE